MSITINKIKEEIPGVKTVSWMDNDPKVKYVTDKNKRTRTPRVIVAHTHEGILGTLLDGLGPNTTIDERLASYQTQTDRMVSWDYTGDKNGDVTCQNDPMVDYTWHGNGTNPVSVGIEMIQNLPTGDLYKEQIAKMVLFIDYLTARLGIQRQIPWDKTKNKPVLTQLKRAATCDDFVGIVGHVNVTSNKGPGDPGPWLFLALKEAGYELFDVSSEEDKKTWKQRQQQLGVTAVDGIPLTATVAALKAVGKKHGMWVARPIDALLPQR